MVEVVLHYVFRVGLFNKVFELSTKQPNKL